MEKEIDYEKWFDCCGKLLSLGFDIDKNSARDLLCAINECYDNYDEYFNSDEKL